ncbi:peroxisome assembly protein (Peroxin-2), partial [Elasticomyces elasticus]
IAAALRAVLWKLSIWNHDASYGATLQGLHYTDARAAIARSPSRAQKGAYGLLTVGGRYAWTKLEAWLTEQEGGYEEPSFGVRQISRLTHFLAATHEIAAFTSFLVFLYDGRYRSLIDRLLRLRLAPTNSYTSREVSFEYLNRQLVWHAFTEFLLFLLPLVGISRWRRWLSRAWRRAKNLFKQKGAEDGQDEKAGGELGFLPERTCAICYAEQNPTPGAGASEAALLAASATSGGVIGSAQTDVTNPYETIPCGCVYCFVCLAQRIEAEEGEGWTCLRCGEVVKECKPWSGDVLEERESREGSRKSVMFADEEKEGMRDMEPMPIEDDPDRLGNPDRRGDNEHARPMNESGEWARIEQEEHVVDENEQTDEARDTDDDNSTRE